MHFFIRSYFAQTAAIESGQLLPTEQCGVMARAEHVSSIADIFFQITCLKEANADVGLWGDVR